LLDIHRLSNSAYPGASRECAGLVMKMVACSYTLGGLRFAASSHRPSDHLADLELQRLALGHRADSETFGYANTASARSAPSEAVFDWRCQLMELRRMQKEVANLGVRVWFPRTMALYEKWEAEEMQAGQYGQWNNNM
jgi:hypothetical protein